MRKIKIISILLFAFSSLTCQQTDKVSKLIDYITSDETHLYVKYMESNEPKTELDFTSTFKMKFSIVKKDKQISDVIIEMSNDSINVSPFKLQMSIKDTLTQEYMDKSNEINQWLTENENAELSFSYLFVYASTINFSVDLLNADLGMDFKNQEVEQNGLLGHLNSTIEKTGKELKWKEIFSANENILSKRISDRVINNSIKAGIDEKDLGLIREEMKNSNSSMTISKEANLDVTNHKISNAKSTMTSKTYIPNMETSVSVVSIEMTKVDFQH